MTILAIIIGPIAVLAGAALNHFLATKTAERTRVLEAIDARDAETRAAIRDFLRAHSDAVLTIRHLALLTEVNNVASRQDAVAMLERMRREVVAMDLAVAAVEWVAPEPIVVASREASKGTEEALTLFDRVGTDAHPTAEDWNHAEVTWAEARSAFMDACRLHFYGERTPPRPDEPAGS